MNQVEHSEAVVRLFSQHQRWLYGYLMALTGNPNDADDVFQEVCVVMWQQHEKFEVGTSFVSWLSVIAYHQVQKYWRDKKKKKHFLGSDLLEQLAESLPNEFDLMEDRRSALGSCIQKLSDVDRQLLSQRYADKKTTARNAAHELGRTTASVYKALNRIRRALFECVNRRLATEGSV